VLEGRSGKFLTGLFARAEGSDSGDAGTITVNADHLHMYDGAEMSVTTEGPGNGGNLWVEAKTIVLEGRSGDFLTGLFARTTGQDLNSGDGGSITVKADRLHLRQGAQISAFSKGDGRAGDICLDLRERFESEAGAVTTASEWAGGGRIKLRAGERVLLNKGSTITTRVHGGEGDAGNIDIDSPLVVLNRSQVIASADQGKGGNIQIIAKNFLASADSQIDASSNLGIDGTVEISAPEVDLSGGLQVLPARFFDASELLRERCTARVGRASLVLVGRGGVPLPPDALQPSLQLGRAGCSWVARETLD
jgi:large exoprotein involved in heme utilization and adhesion